MSMKDDDAYFVNALGGLADAFEEMAAVKRDRGVVMASKLHRAYSHGEAQAFRFAADQLRLIIEARP